MRCKSEETMEQIKNAVEEFYFSHYRSPSIGELAAEVGYAKSTVHSYLWEMDRRGLLSYNGKTAETAVTRKANAEVVLTPVLGSISCGEPEYAEENFESYVALPTALFGSGEFFLLRARGYSMVEAGIEPGDLVVIKKQNTADEGDIIVALVDNETTLKRFYIDHEKGCIRLHPENSTMEDIYTDRCYVQGVAQQVIKQLTYCRVSTKQDEQLNSYENQVNHYTERIHREPGWKLVGIYADKGITGTSMKKRDEFNKLIRQCKRGRVDMIIVKSISRFARNTLDCIKITRMLREIKVDVYFEEQNLHSIDPASEFYISIYGSIAQSESENISHNVAWGKAQSAKEGNVSFTYKSFLGYRKGADGKPEIDPAQAITVRRIYTEFLSGSSLQQIADGLTADGIPTPMGKAVWQPGVIQSILSNVKYKGDALLGKTYVEDCISKKVRINGGERPQYYVENNHPAIIDADTFAQVQEELARRASKRKVKQIGTTTEQGKYCGKYALTELLICGECGTPYRRCTWTAGGQKRIVWRCINRLDYGKKYCHHSPTMEEAPLQEAIMNAILKTAKNNPDILQTLKMHIQIGLGAETGEDESVDIQIRIAQIDKEFGGILNTVTAENPESLLTDPRIEALMTEKRMLENRLTEYISAEQHRKNAKSRLEQIFTILNGMKNHPLTFDNEIIRKILQCVIVESKDRIKVVFIGGLEVKVEVE